MSISTSSAAVGSGSQVCRLAGEELVPPVIAALDHVEALAGEGEVAHDDHVADAGGMSQGLVRGLFQRHGPSPSAGSVGGYQGPCPGVVQAVGDRPGSETGEQRQQDSPDAGRGEQGDDDLGRHRHVQADDVPLAQAQGAQRVGAAADLVRQLAVGEARRGPLLVFGGQGGSPRGFRVGEPLVEAAFDDVELAADTPARERHSPGKVEDLRPGPGEADVEEIDDPLREPADVFGGAPLQLFERADAGALHEGREVAAGDPFRIRTPDEIEVLRAGRGRSVAHGIAGSHTA